MSSIHRIINTDNLIDLYRYSISKYDSLKAFQILGDNISYSAFNKDVEKMANYFENMKRSAIQIAIENSYYYAVAYFAVIISNNIAVLSNNNLEKYDNKIKIKQKITEELVKKTISDDKSYKEFKYYSNYNNQEPCTIIFSSGTTKEPKAIMLSMENITTNVVSCLNRIMYLPTDKCINVIPQNHIFGLMELLTTIYSGASICVLQSKYQLFNMIDTYDPNYLNLPPILVENLLKEIKQGNIKGKNLRRIMCGGAYIADKIINEYKKYGINIYRCYGLSEAPCIAAGGEYEENNDGLGKVLDCNSVIIDKNGQILVHGKNVMLGYIGNIKQPFVTINHRKYLKTNDIGKIGENGNLYVIGRMDNIISLKNGNKILKETIERRLLEIEGITECRANATNEDIYVEIVTEFPKDAIKRIVLQMQFRRK